MEGDSDTVKENGRSRRQKHDRHGRLAALQKLKGLKGTKNKYDVEEIDDVYEEVDEKEYSKRVQRRQEDDWIIDDDGSGYVEDGREVFDDDLGDGEVGKRGAREKTKKKERGVPVRSSNIKNMFMNQPAKNKDREAKIQDDDILGDIMQELSSVPSTTTMRSSMTALKKKTLTPSPSINRTPTSISRMATNNRMISRQVKAEPKRLPFEGESFTSSPSVSNIEDCSSQMDGPLDWLDEDMNIDEVESQPDTKPLENNETVVIEKENVAQLEIQGANMLKKDTPQISEHDLTSGWETIKSSTELNQTVATVDLNNTELPLVLGEDGEQVLRMYWLDAYEDPYVQPGTVYLFGKVYIETAKSYVSCCLTVKNIERHVYVLPRDTCYDLKTNQSTDTPVNFIDVYEEFNTRIAERYKILQFKSRRVTKKYGFEPASVPRESEYLEVRYSAEHNLPANLKGSTFSHVFGTNASTLENFLLEKRIKGPCWLNIKNAQKANAPISWCKIEALVLNMDQIEVTSTGGTPPPLTVMSLGLRTVVNSRTQQVEIVAASCLVHQEFHLDKSAPQIPFQQHFCILSRPTEEAWPLDHREGLSGSKVTKVERTESERALLNLFLARVNKIDPDIVVGHDIASYDLDILLHRFSQNKVQNWSRLGRLRRTNMPQSKGISRSHLAMSGRLVCDVKISARELIRARSYDLDTLCQQVLRKTGSRPDLSSDAVKKMYSSCSTLLGMVAITMQDTANTLKLMYELNVLPLALQITCIAGNLLSRTLLGGRSERNEYLLLHAFHEKGYIVPDRQSFKKQAKGNDSDMEEDASGESNRKTTKGRRKPAYAGGLVLDPKRGFYDKYVLLMDFNSLYPSIIQEFNICFTTIDRKMDEKNEGDEEVLPDLPDSSLAAGILPTEIRKLVDSRREVKKLMKGNVSTELMQQYDIRQKALKLTANSMYGCLGFSHSRFYAKPLAALITSKGREILLQTRELVRKLNLDVIYGDTDSLMIDSNSNDYDQVLKLGLKIKAEVNKLYKHLELDVDGVFQRLLLLKKKKYAAVTVTRLSNGTMSTQQELKGLDVVRRDWSQLATQAGRYALEQILGDVAADERIARIQQHLEGIRDGFKNGTIDFSLLEIAKQLTKNPENYPDAKNLPHVQVALRMNSRGGKKMVQGDTVSYIICQDGSNMAATQRAYTMDELKSKQNPLLTPDVQYYLAQQVHPVVSRLCELLEGIDGVRIAEFLGLDASSYRSSHSSSNNIEYEAGNPPISDEERFQSCERFQFKCPDKDCGADVILDDVFRKQENGQIEFSLLRCVNPNCKASPLNHIPYILNRLTQTLRKNIHRYYLGWLVCEDQSCGARTRRLPLKSVRAFPVCIGCGSSNMDLEYNDTDLYTQLCFYQHVFDAKKAMNQLSQNDRDQVQAVYSQTLVSAYKRLFQHVQQVLLQSAYSQVNLSSLFFMFCSKK